MAKMKFRLLASTREEAHSGAVGLHRSLLITMYNISWMESTCNSCGWCVLSTER